MLSDFRWNFLEQQFFENVVECDFADQILDMGGKLIGATAFSRDAVEDGVDALLLRLSVNVAEIVEELVPFSSRVFFQKRVDGRVLAA